MNGIWCKLLRWALLMEGATLGSVTLVLISI